MVDNKTRHYEGLPLALIVRLWVIAFFAYLRVTDFRIWGLLSCGLWIASSVCGIVADYHSEVVLIHINLLGQGFGIMAAVTGLFSIGSIWDALKTRHALISPPPNKSIRDYINITFGICVSEDLQSSAFSIDTKQFFNAAESLCGFEVAKSAAELNLFTAINLIYYARGVYGGFYEPKRHRNGLISSRNVLSQLLIRRHMDEPFCGISSILPMRKTEWEVYAASGVSDNFLDIKLIAPYSGTGVFDFDVLLLFSIGIVDTKVRRYAPPTWPRADGGTLLFIAVILHVLLYMAAGRKRSVTLYVGADDPATTKALRNLGFRDTQLKIGEGIPLYSVEMRLI